MNSRRLKAGETLAETLIAMLVVVFAVLILAGAVVAAARVNRSTQDQDVAFHLGAGSPSRVKVDISAQVGGFPVSAEGAPALWVKRYSTDEGYLYYEYDSYDEPNNTEP